MDVETKNRFIGRIEMCQETRDLVCLRKVENDYRAGGKWDLALDRFFNSTSNLLEIPAPSIQSWPLMSRTRREEFLRFLDRYAAQKPINSVLLVSLWMSYLTCGSRHV